MGLVQNRRGYRANVTGRPTHWPVGPSGCEGRRPTLGPIPELGTVATLTPLFCWICSPITLVPFSREAK